MNTTLHNIAIDESTTQVRGRVVHTKWARNLLAFLMVFGPGLIVMLLTKRTAPGNPDKNYFVVVHPLDDAPESKCDASQLGAMPMTRSVRLSLMTLRGYPNIMAILVGYRAFDLAGLFGRTH